jgi:hypothetical protein
MIDMDDLMQRMAACIETALEIIDADLDEDFLVGRPPVRAWIARMEGRMKDAGHACAHEPRLYSESRFFHVAANRQALPAG